LQSFLTDADRTHLLTADEEAELAKRIEHGDPEARRALIEANIRLVVAIARKYHSPGLSLWDLVQEGSIGLIEAVDRYNHRLGYRFSTYSTWHIAGAVKRSLVRGRLIRLPPRVIDHQRRFKAAEAELAQELAREPSIKELAAVTGLTLSEVGEIRALAEAPASLQRPPIPDTAGDASWLADQAVSEVEQILLRETIRSALCTLDERERRIVELRFGFTGEPRSLEQVGVVVGLSHERVRQIESAALEQLRPLLAS
jgi:RNA polymerase primary sigma factor